MLQFILVLIAAQKDLNFQHMNSAIHSSKRISSNRFPFKSLSQYCKIDKVEAPAFLQLESQLKQLYKDRVILQRNDNHTPQAEAFVNLNQKIIEIEAKLNDVQLAAFDPLFIIYGSLLLFVIGFRMKK